MIVKIKNSTTGDILELSTRDLIEIDIEPETKAEEANDFWGCRQSVNSFITDIRNGSKLVDGR